MRSSSGTFSEARWSSGCGWNEICLAARYLMGCGEAALLRFPQATLICRDLFPMTDAKRESLLVPGPAGVLEAVLDVPPSPTAIAVVCHPHPPDGGTMHHKVPMAIARELVRLGCAALRFNFRGVGQSEGTYDRGVGEVEDALAAAAWLGARHPGLPLSLAGFSFGAAVATLAAARLDPPPASLILAGTSPKRVPTPPVGVPALVVHGEHDDIVPLADVMDWARPQTLPVTVVPGAGHFFHGQLPLLQDLVRGFWRGCAASDSLAG